MRPMNPVLPADLDHQQDLSLPVVLMGRGRCHLIRVGLALPALLLSHPFQECPEHLALPAVPDHQGDRLPPDPLPPHDYPVHPAVPAVPAALLSYWLVRLLRLPPASPEPFPIQR